MYILCLRTSLTHTVLVTFGDLSFSGRQTHTAKVIVAKTAQSVKAKINVIKTPEFQKGRNFNFARYRQHG